MTYKEFKPIKLQAWTACGWEPFECETDFPMFLSRCNAVITCGSHVDDLSMALFYTKFLKEESMPPPTTMCTDTSHLWTRLYRQTDIARRVDQARALCNHNFEVNGRRLVRKSY